MAKRRQKMRPKRMITIDEVHAMGIRRGTIPIRVYLQVRDELIEPSFDPTLATRLAQQEVRERNANR